MITDETKEKLNTLKATLDPFRVLQLINYEKSSPIDTGDEIRDYCPIHKGDKQRSLTINKDKKTFFCHSCGEKGDLIYLYQKSTERNFKDSCQDLNLPDSPHYFPAQKTTESGKKRTLQQVINESKPLVSHPYLTAKRVDPCDGLLQGKDDRRNDSIVVPLKNISGELQAVQFVHENGKFFNGPSKGAFFIIGSLETSPKVWLAEGIATALTIWRAYNKEITVISFGSIINLPTVVSRIKTKYPETELIICLDYGTAAFKKAHKLDQEYPNLKYCTPSFEGLSYQEEKKPTDFNDLISQCNLKDLDVQKQLEKTITIHEIPKEPQNETARITVKADVLSRSTPVKINTMLEEINLIDIIKNRAEEYAKNGKTTLSGLSTGYEKLDEITDGFQKEHLIILAARTAMGKSWVALNFIKNIAIDQQRPATLFSLEMSNNQIIYRLLSLCSKVPARKIRNGDLTNTELEKINKAYEQIKSSPLFLSDCPKNSNLEELRKNISKASKESDLIVIDHVGLIKAYNNQNNNRVSEMGEITRSLKLSTKEHKIPILCVAQLNRNADKDEPPKLSDLRESGSIEQDSDVVIFIHRSDYFSEEKKPKELDLIIAKNRDGEQGKTVNFTYDKGSWHIKEKAVINEEIKPAQRVNAVNNETHVVKKEAARESFMPEG